MEFFVIKELTGVDLTVSTAVRDSAAPYLANTANWKYVPASELPRHSQDILVEPILVEALMQLNPAINGHPDRAEEVIHKLRGILVITRQIGLVRANEQFSEWLRGENTMPYGENHQHIPIRLIDFDDIHRNSFIVTNQYTVQTNVKKIPDMVLLVNGIPLVVGEFKTPSRPAISWFDGAVDIHDDYEVNIPALFAPNVFSFATEGKYFRYGSIRMPLEIWGPWREEKQTKKDDDATTEIMTAVGLQEDSQAIHSMLKRAVVFDILQNFAVFATDKQNRKIKIICRYQQYDAAIELSTG